LGLSTFINRNETMIELKRILAATDFSECSDHALRYACEFAEAFGAALHLLHVNEPPAAAYSEFGIGYVGVQELEEELKRGAAAKLETLPSSPWQGKLALTREVVMGTPFVEIVRYARDRDIDLIVVGTHGRGAIAHMLMGSTAERVVRKAPCPVLTVRAEAHEFVMP
jgi:nucleotide-binding universal stress UspA family protein